MAQRSEARTRPGWALEPNLDPVTELVRRRRWRVLRAALPVGRGLDPIPSGIRTPEEFVDWLLLRLSPMAAKAYFEDLEFIARQTCDLELLRFARTFRFRR